MLATVQQAEELLDMKNQAVPNLAVTSQPVHHLFDTIDYVQLDTYNIHEHSAHHSSYHSTKTTTPYSYYTHYDHNHVHLILEDHTLIMYTIMGNVNMYSFPFATLNRVKRSH